jgi:UDP:flavonoid glycosyltransferase YjiC (YdhE family)
MRVLVTVNDAYGHVLPLVPTVQEMSDRGHEVVLAIPGHSTPRLELHDVRVTRYRTHPVRPPEEGPPRSQYAERLTWAVETSWPNDARGWAAELLADAREFAPDVVMCEPVEHAGRAVAAALGLPLVEHGWGFTLPAGVDKRATAGLQDVYDAVGAAPREPALRVDLGPSDTQAGDIDPDVLRFRYTPWSSPAPDLPPPIDGLDRVLVTLGTAAHSGAAERLRAVVSALARPGVEVIVVLANEDRGKADGWPPGVVAAPWADMPAEIARCSLIAHHGGAGTAWATLCAGRPAVCFPQAGDQLRNASLLAKAGAALVVAPDVVDESSLTDVFTEALADDALAMRADEIRLANERLPSASALVDHVESVVHGR